MPANSPTRSFSAAVKSISPFMARRVMSATFSRSPMKSASSSSISFSITVDSMSAISSFLRRPWRAWIATSTRRCSSAFCTADRDFPRSAAEKAMSQAIPGASQSTASVRAPDSPRASSAIPAMVSSRIRPPAMLSSPSRFLAPAIRVRTFCMGAYWVPPAVLASATHAAGPGPSGVTEQRRDSLRMMP